MFKKIPIAWLQLKYQKGQTIAAILGIAFTAILLFMQIGFRSGFLESLVQLPSSFQSEVFLMSASTTTVLKPVTFSERRLYQALAFKEVESFTPIYMSIILWKNPKNKAVFIERIQVIGFPVTSSVIDLPGIEDNIDKLKLDNAFLLDEKSRPELAPVVSDIKNQGKAITEIKTNSGLKKIEVIGLFQLGANTTFNGTVITSDSNFFNIFGRNREEINLGLINLKPGVDTQKIISKMENYFPNDVKILSKSELITKEKDFYEYGSPVGLIFRFGLSGAIIVGTIILYQILYQKISKFIKDYATLKAIGHSHNSLVMIVLEQTLILAILGYIPGLILSGFMYEQLAKDTSLKFEMTFSVAIAVLLLICLICLTSGLIAVRKLKEADPADIFS
ncbi:ABC transporter permease DevC [Moorena sp. SIO3H5]|uniref:ABC transporter permease DevC n=1 Tax=Moorena sp. SIO3H5 TaxID=2607834 RepID=UPI0013BC6792|nr:ABC transporter permease DevC [Moorena sp. SIO3H5]NEO68376.1 FtsX-like permease family protein [Moorena sp. SIO3H5]